MLQDRLAQRSAFVLPVDKQLEGIKKIMSGVNSPNPQIDLFIRQSAAKGMMPEQIRQAIIIRHNQKAF